MINNSIDLENKIIDILNMIGTRHDDYLISKVSKKIEDNLTFPIPEDIVWPAFLYFWVGQDNVSYEDFKEWRKM